MNIKFKKISEKAIEPKLNNDGSISMFACDIQQAVDNARRTVIIYNTGFEVTVENDYNLLVFPAKYNVSKSVSFQSDMLYSGLDVNSFGEDKSGDNQGKNSKEFIVEYKIDTNAIPAMYNAGSEIARLYPIRKEGVLLDIAEYVAPVAQTEEPVVESVQAEEV